MSVHQTENYMHHRRAHGVPALKPAVVAFNHSYHSGMRDGRSRPDPCLPLRYLARDFAIPSAAELPARIYCRAVQARGSDLV